MPVGKRLLTRRVIKVSGLNIFASQQRILYDVFDKSKSTLIHSPEQEELNHISFLDCHLQIQINSL